MEKGDAGKKVFSVKTLDVHAVDDDPEIASEIVDCLRKAGVACADVGDGWEALKLFAEGGQVGVVVCDQRMPELDGLQLADHLLDLRDRKGRRSSSSAAVPALTMLSKPCDCGRATCSPNQSPQGSWPVVWRIAALPPVR